MLREWMLKFPLQKDVAAGLLFVAIGVAFSYASYSYRMGVLNNMGPGYFPFWLGVVLAVFGAGAFVGGVRAGRSDGGAHERWDLKALLIIVGSMALFGILLVPLGLVGAIIVLVVVSSLASREFSWLTTLLTTLVLIALSLVIFVLGIGLPLPIWPAFFAA